MNVVRRPAILAIIIENYIDIEPLFLPLPREPHRGTRKDPTTRRLDEPLPRNAVIAIVIVSPTVLSIPTLRANDAGSGGDADDTGLNPTP